VTSLSDLSSDPSKYVRDAAAKAASGAKLTSNEERRLNTALARGPASSFDVRQRLEDRMRDIAIPPVRLPSREAKELAEEQRHAKPIEEIENLTQKLRGGNGTAATVADLESRIAALETSNATLVALVSGLSRQTVTYCSGGSSSSKTILMS
jgi:hypothetical protein